MPKPQKTGERSAIAPGGPARISMEELEERLEMQQAPSMDPAIACYTDLCPSDCGTHCAAGYTGCIDLCSCDGMRCTVECPELCVVESCLVDIV